MHKGRSYSSGYWLSLFNLCAKRYYESASKAEPHTCDVVYNFHARRLLMKLPPRVMLRIR
jgi:hypothetical protein